MLKCALILVVSLFLSMFDFTQISVILYDNPHKSNKSVT
jgi:hypothetical protein